MSEVKPVVGEPVCMYCSSELKEKIVVYVAPFCPKCGQKDYGYKIAEEPDDEPRL